MEPTSGKNLGFEAGQTWFEVRIGRVFHEVKDSSLSLTTRWKLNACVSEVGEEFNEKRIEGSL